MHESIYFSSFPVQRFSFISHNKIHRRTLQLQKVSSNMWKTFPFNDKPISTYKWSLKYEAKRSFKYSCIYQIIRLTRHFMTRSFTWIEIVLYAMCSSKFHKIIWSLWFISFFMIRTDSQICTLQWNPMMLVGVSILYTEAVASKQRLSSCQLDGITITCIVDMFYHDRLQQILQSWNVTGSSPLCFFITTKR